MTFFIGDNIKKLTPNEAQTKIREIAKLGDITPTYHCLLDSMDLRSYSIHDVDLILKKGTVNEPPEYDKSYHNWKYKVEGKAIEGDKAIVITVILSYRELLAITIMPKKGI